MYYEIQARREDEESEIMDLEYYFIQKFSKLKLHYPLKRLIITTIVVIIHF